MISGRIKLKYSQKVTFFRYYNGLKERAHVEQGSSFHFCNFNINKSN